ncbi:MAG: tetratricopeptide repeat protein [Paludibacteraceae bacterium]|nr:tetratricopeptide repeat protein [Paludibacteraceae bacterium]
MENILGKLDNAEQLLLERHLQQALDLISEISSNNQTKEYIEEIQLIYRPLLTYALQDIEDKESNTILNSLIQKTFILIDNIRYEFQRTNSFFESKERGNLNIEITINQIIQKSEQKSVRSLISEVFDKENDYKEDTFDIEKSNKELFYSILSSQRWENSSLEIFSQLLQNPTIPPTSKCLSISAFMLNALSFFDENKILFLFKIWDKVEKEVSYRIIVALVLILNKYENRIAIFHSIFQYLQKLTKDKKFVELVKFSIIQLVRTSETDAITKKIKDEILPEMLKFSTQIKDKIDNGKIDIDDIEEQSAAWQEFFEENNLSDKMEEFSDLQRDGSDVYMSTFSGLKSYPFFNSAYNWFLPFDTKHSSVNQLFKHDSEFLSILTENSWMCNSDKYSFCLTLSQLPQNQWNSMINNSKMESQQLQSDKDDKKLTKPTLEIEQNINQYVQDLYRFYKLFPAKVTYNPFNEVLKIHKNLFLRNLFDKNDLTSIADFYFTKKIYSAAFELFKDFSETKNDIAILKKMGYCAQQMQHWNQAIDFYNNVLLFDPQNKWTLKRLAFCSKKLNQWKNALSFYKEAEKLEPDNLKIQQNIANCLFELKKYEEALSLFFKIEYLSPNNHDIQQAIVFCSLFCDKKEQALKYSNKLKENNPKFDDFILIGFCHFLTKNKEEAINHFQKGYLEIKSKEDFFARFNEIGLIFQNFGINYNKLNLLNEFLRLHFSKL